MRIFRKSGKDKPKIIIICCVDDFYIMVKPEHVDKMRKKLRKYFGIVEDGQLREMLGVQYEWKIFDPGEIYVVMSTKEKAEEIIKQYENYTGKNSNNYPSPGAPGTTLQKKRRRKNQHEVYMSLVGQTMFYSTKIAPEFFFAGGQL